MKAVKVLLALFSISLVMTSCYTTESLSGSNDTEGTTRRIGNRVYVDDPYYGQVILEQDPFTGRYYDVSNGGFGRFRSPYNRFGGYPVYRGSYQGNRPVIVRPQPVRPAPRRAIPQPNTRQREEARKTVLGDRK